MTQDFFFVPSNASFEALVLPIQAPAKGPTILSLFWFSLPLLSTPAWCFVSGRCPGRLMDRELQGALATSGSRTARLFSCHSLSIHPNNLYTPIHCHCLPYETIPYQHKKDNRLRVIFSDCIYNPTPQIRIKVKKGRQQVIISKDRERDSPKKFLPSLAPSARTDSPVQPLMSHNDPISPLLSLSY